MDTASTSDAVTFITYVQSLKRKIKQFEKQVEVSAVVAGLKSSGAVAGVLGVDSGWWAGHSEPTRAMFSCIGSPLCWVRRSMGPAPQHLHRPHG